MRDSSSPHITIFRTQLRENASRSHPVSGFPDYNRFSSIENCCWVGKWTCVGLCVASLRIPNLCVCRKGGWCEIGYRSRQQQVFWTRCVSPSFSYHWNRCDLGCWSLRNVHSDRSRLSSRPSPRPHFSGTLLMKIKVNKKRRDYTQYLVNF